VKVNREFEVYGLRKFSNFSFKVPKLIVHTGATICGYAADINGILVEAVVVEKQKARQVFDNETKKFEKKKAALAEQVVGNVFSTSINCTAPLAIRTIKLVFIQPLKFDEKTTTYSYKLPFQLSEPIPHFGFVSTVVRVDGLTSARLVITSPMLKQNVCNLLDSTGHFPFQAMGDYYTLNFNLNEAKFDGEDLVVRTAFKPNVKHLAIVEQLNNELFFAVHDWSKIGQINNKSPSQPFAAKKIAIYWQRSFNLRDEASLSRQIELVGRIVQELENNFVTSCDVMTFGETVEALGLYSTSHSSAAELMNNLRKIQYEGALDLESLSMSLKELVEHNPSMYRSIIVFTDGINALGPTRILAPSLSVPLHIICGPEKCNPSLMGNWAKNNLGKFINLNETSNNNDIVNSVILNGKSKLGLVSVDVNITGDASIFPRQILDLAEDGVSIYGSFSTETIPQKVSKVKLTLKYGNSGAATEDNIIDLALKRLDLEGNDAIHNAVVNEDTNKHIIGKFWANVKIKHLSDEKNKDELKVSSYYIILLIIGIDIFLSKGRVCNPWS